MMVKLTFINFNVLSHTLPGKNKQKSSNEFVIHALENINRDLVLLGISDTHNKYKRNSPCMHTYFARLAVTTELSVSCRKITPPTYFLQ